MDPDQISSHLKTRRVGRKILIYDSTSSTQTIAAEYAKNKENDGLVIFTEEQTAGKGRAGNTWHSGRSDSILCSILLTQSKLGAELLSLTCAVAVAEAIGKPANIKWPNDIFLSGKKVAGILLESKTYNKRNAYIVGIGINCHQRKDSFPEDLRSAATSLDIESRTMTDRVSLAKRLLTSVDDWLDAAQTNAEKVTKRWRELSIQLGHRVALVFNGRKFTGHCIGVDPEKGLILRLDTGGVRMFDAAHTTIVKEDRNSQKT